jgi:hypothetical protein
MKTLLTEALSVKDRQEIQPASASASQEGFAVA